MKAGKLFQYAYIVFAVLFIYDGVSKWGDGTNGAYISLGLAALAIFMYFFRKKFNKKFEDKKNSK
jgi:LPXTG-motif cell wall-anchored protein